jgi:hypothetical protein
LTAGINDWRTVKTYKTTVQGAGPFLVAIEALDQGVISGIAAAVIVDGQVYSATGVPGTKFKLLPIFDDALKAMVPADWSSSPTFNDADWIAASGDPRTGNAYMWGDVEARVAAAAGAPAVRMAWAPNSDITNIKNLARLVVVPPSCGKLCFFHLLLLLLLFLEIRYTIRL